LPVAEGAFDLVVASLSLHWVNDLPGALIQIRRALAPDGLFLASLPGLPSFGALRSALAEAEAELRKIPFFVRGKARRNTERFAEERGIALITLETLYDAKAHFSR
jgi:SAM-dependent methyltransferase